jgi:uncharacterized protein (DUF433 family)
VARLDSQLLTADARTLAVVHRSMVALEGTYEAQRAAALSGVPVSTVYDWARKDVLVPSVSQHKEMLWSYADLMGLRIVYWLRHPKGEEGEVPASPMKEVRAALERLDREDMDLWSVGNPRGSALLADRAGRVIVAGEPMTTASGQGLLDMLDVLGPFAQGQVRGPDLRTPRPHLRIIPGRCAGEPHIVGTRITTLSVAALRTRGFDLDKIGELYPDEDPAALAEAVDLEAHLAA